MVNPTQSPHPLHPQPEQAQAILNNAAAATPIEIIDSAAMHQNLPQLQSSGTFLSLASGPYISTSPTSGLSHAAYLQLRQDDRQPQVWILNCTGKSMAALNTRDASTASDIIKALEAEKRVTVDSLTLFQEELAAIRSLSTSPRAEYRLRDGFTDMMVLDLRLRSREQLQEFWAAMKGGLFEAVYAADPGILRHLDKVPDAKWAVTTAGIFGESACGLLEEAVCAKRDRDVRDLAVSKLAALGHAGMPMLISLFESPQAPEVSLAISGLVELFRLDAEDMCSHEQAVRVLQRIQELRSSDSPINGYRGSQKMLTKIIGWVGRQAIKEALDMIKLDLEMYIHDEVDLDMNGPYGDGAHDVAIAAQLLAQHEPGCLDPLRETIERLPTGYPKDRISWALSAG